jgi:voltage-gated potassium channel
MAKPDSGNLARYRNRAQTLRSLLRKVAVFLRLPHWFPHVPLSLALAGGGMLLLLTASQEGLAILVSSDIIHSTVASLQTGTLVVPRTLLGVAMLTMSIGLLLRSRFSWTISLLLTGGTLILAFRLSASFYSLLAYYNALLLVALLLAHRVFDRSSVAAGSLFAVVSSLMLVCYAVFGSFYLGSQFDPPIRDLTTALYYSIVTMATVGFGDITPRTADARLFTVSIIILGITVFATSISAIVGPIVSGSLQRILNRKEKRMKRKDHFIIAGQSVLAHNAYLELRRRGQPVTLIFMRPPAGDDFANADVIIGDPTDLDVLRRAGAEDARAILAMRDDDSDNAFIVLAVKELDTKAKTVAAVNDTKNVGRVKRVHPDIIIAPQVLGGELLAMALSGESIDSAAMLERFLHFDAAK